MVHTHGRAPQWPSRWIRWPDGRVERAGALNGTEIALMGHGDHLDIGAAKWGLR